MSSPNIRTKRKVTRALRAYGRRMDEWTKPIEYTSKLSIKAANRLLIGFMFDQNDVAEYAWDKSEFLCESIGEPLWENIANMELRRLRGLLRYGYGGYAYHRYYKKYAVKLKEAATHLLEEYRGDPRKIWNATRNIDLVKKRLDNVPLIGPALANFAILTLARNYGLLGGKNTLKELNVKPDIQVTRVFRRSGLVSSPSTFKEI